MKPGYKFFYFSFIFLVACGENDNFSAGVSLGGSGTGPFQAGTTTPRPSDIPDPGGNIVDEYIIWSNGKLEDQCGDVKISMQFLHSQTKQPLEIGQGSFVPQPSEAEPTNVSIQITTENLSQRPIFEYFTECKSNLRLQDQSGNEYKDIQEFVCPNDSMARQYGSLEKKTYQYNFLVTLALGQRKIIYKPDFSTEIQVPKEHRLNCCQRHSKIDPFYLTNGKVKLTPLISY